MDSTSLITRIQSQHELSIDEDAARYQNEDQTLFYHHKTNDLLQNTNQSNQDHAQSQYECSRYSGLVYNPYEVPRTINNTVDTQLQQQHRLELSGEDKLYPKSLAIANDNREGAHSETKEECDYYTRTVLHQGAISDQTTSVIDNYTVPVGDQSFSKGILLATLTSGSTNQTRHLLDDVSDEPCNANFELYGHALNTPPYDYQQNQHLNLHHNNIIENLNSVSSGVQPKSIVATETNEQFIEIQHEQQQLQLPIRNLIIQNEEPEGGGNNYSEDHRVVSYCDDFAVNNYVYKDHSNTQVQRTKLTVDNNIVPFDYTPLDFLQPLKDPMTCENDRINSDIITLPPSQDHIFPSNNNEEHQIYYQTGERQFQGLSMTTINRPSVLLENYEPHQLEELGRVKGSDYNSILAHSDIESSTRTATTAHDITYQEYSSFNSQSDQQRSNESYEDLSLISLTRNQYHSRQQYDHLNQVANSTTIDRHEGDRLYYNDNQLLKQELNHQQVANFNYTNSNLNNNDHLSSHQNNYNYEHYNHNTVGGREEELIVKSNAADHGSFRSSISFGESQESADCLLNTSSATSTMSLDDDEDGDSITNSISRDERKAREANIPMSYHDIVNMTIDQFNEKLSQYDLTETQINLIKDIRRRGKNKVAAQSCRKRKLEQISELQHSVDMLARQRLSLNNEYNQIIRQHDELVQQYDRLCNILKMNQQQDQQQQDHDVISKANCNLMSASSSSAVNSISINTS